MKLLHFTPDVNTNTVRPGPKYSEKSPSGISRGFLRISICSRGTMSGILNHWKRGFVFKMDPTHFKIGATFDPPTVMSKGI